MLSQADKRDKYVVRYIQYVDIYCFIYLNLNKYPNKFMHRDMGIHDRECANIYMSSPGIYPFWMQMQLQQSFSETLLLGNHCLLCNLARLLDGVFDSTVYLLDIMRTRPSIVTNHLASSVTAQGKKLHCQAFPLRLLITFWSSGVREHKSKRMCSTARAADVKLPGLRLAVFWLCSREVSREAITAVNYWLCYNGRSESGTPVEGNCSVL